MILLMTLLLNWPFNYLISMFLLGKFSCFCQCSCWYTSTCRRFFQSWQRVFLQKQPDVVCPSCQLKILRWMCGIVCIFSKVKWADSRTRWTDEGLNDLRLQNSIHAFLLYCWSGVLPPGKLKKLILSSEFFWLSLLQPETGQYICSITYWLQEQHSI